MKIAAPTPTRPKAPIQAPLGLDDEGLCQTVLSPLPTNDAGWLALVDRLPAGGGLLAARLVACLSRSDEAGAAVVKGLKAIGDRRRAKEHVPDQWIDRLADLIVEGYDAVCCLDDAAHDAAHVPQWVEVPADQRPIPSTEVSWPRIARLVRRAVQAIPGDSWNDAVSDSLALIDPYRDCTADEVERIRGACREAVRQAVRASYGAR